MTSFSHTFFFLLSFCTKNNIYFPAFLLYNHTHACEKQKTKERGAGFKKSCQKNNERFNQKMEQHQPDQTDHLRIDHWSGSWSCCSAGIRNLDSRNHVRRSTERNRPASGILPGYECTLPHEVWSEDQFKIYYHFVHGW